MRLKPGPRLSAVVLERGQRKHEELGMYVGSLPRRSIYP